MLILLLLFDTVSFTSLRTFPIHCRFYGLRSFNASAETSYLREIICMPDNLYLCWLEILSNLLYNSSTENTYFLHTAYLAPSPQLACQPVDDPFFISF